MSAVALPPSAGDEAHDPDPPTRPAAVCSTFQPFPALGNHAPTWRRQVQSGGLRGSAAPSARASAPFADDDRRTLRVAFSALSELSHFDLARAPRLAGPGAQVLVGIGQVDLLADQTDLQLAPGQPATCAGGRSAPAPRCADCYADQQHVRQPSSTPGDSVGVQQPALTLRHAAILRTMPSWRQSVLVTPRPRKTDPGPPSWTRRPAGRRRSRPRDRASVIHLDSVAFTASRASGPGRGVAACRLRARRAGPGAGGPGRPTA